MSSTDLVTKEAEAGKKPVVSRRVRQAIDALITGKARTQKEAAEQAHIAPETLCRNLKRPQVQAFYAQRVRETIAVMQLRATAVLSDMLDGAASEHVRKDLAFGVLRMNGLDQGAPVVNINVGQPVGYVINLSDAPLNGQVIDGTAEVVA